MTYPVVPSASLRGAFTKLGENSLHSAGYFVKSPLLEGSTKGWYGRLVVVVCELCGCRWKEEKAPPPLVLLNFSLSLCSSLHSREGENVKGLPKNCHHQWRRRTAILHLLWFREVDRGERKKKVEEDFRRSSIGVCAFSRFIHVRFPISISSFPSPGTNCVEELRQSIYHQKRMEKEGKKPLILLPPPPPLQPTR